MECHLGEIVSAPASKLSRPLLYALLFKALLVGVVFGCYLSTKNKANLKKHGQIIGHLVEICDISSQCG